ncbi:MAG TPA: hypothetical protein VF484_00455 [Candidatus Limnocylindrales bacterium]
MDRGLIIALVPATVLGLAMVGWVTWRLRSLGWYALLRALVYLVAIAAGLGLFLASALHSTAWLIGSIALFAVGIGASFHPAVRGRPVLPPEQRGVPPPAELGLVLGSFMTAVTFGVLALSGDLGPAAIAIAVTTGLSAGVGGYVAGRLARNRLP